MIIEAAPGIYSIPGSNNAVYKVSIEHQRCTCPDRVSPCKHLYACEVIEAKRRCRRSTASTPYRRHEKTQEDISRNRLHPDQGSSTSHRRGGYLGDILCDPDQIDRIAKRLGGG